jgi:predicted thioesterase
MPVGMTTVGTRVELDHKLPTPIGRRVYAVAKLAKVDGRKLLFEVTVADGPSGESAAVVAEGRVERVFVDRHRFVERAVGGS